MPDKIEIDANRALAINAVNRRLGAVSRDLWGIVEIAAMDTITGALNQVVNEQVERAYASAADVTAAQQQPHAILEKAAKALNEMEFREAAE